MGGCLSNWNNNNSISVDDKKPNKNKKKDSSSSAIKAMEDMVNVITGKGDLRQYTVPVTASQVLHSETTSSSSSSSSTTDSNNDDDIVGWFLCNSDSLYYEEYIKALDVEEELEGGQIYFLLPATKLHHPLTASDMAALAVKASLAFQHTTTTTTITSSNHQHKIHHHKQLQQQRNISGKKNNNNNKARISPDFLLAAADDGDHEQQNQFTLSSSSMMRKHQSLSDNKSSSSKAHLGVSKSVRKLQRYSSTRAKLAVRSFRLRLTTIYEGSVLQFYS